MAAIRPARDHSSLESADTLSAGALGFMPRLLVLTTLPHRRPNGCQFVRVNGRHTLRMSAPRGIGLPYGSYSRLLLAYLTTQAVRSKNPEIHLGASPNDLARELGLSTISGPRGTAQRLEEKLRRLLSTRLHWKTSLGLHPATSGSGFIGARRPGFLNLARELLPGRSAWHGEIVLSRDFFKEITRSAVPIDLRALRSLKTSPLAMDLYIWLTYRMSYLRKPALIPWDRLQAQFGSDYSRLRDFRRKVLAYLEEALNVYPDVRVQLSSIGLRLYPSPPHVRFRPVQPTWRRSTAVSSRSTPSNRQ